MIPVQICSRVTPILAMLFLVGVLCEAVCFAEDSGIRFALEIRSAPEVDALIESHDLVKAESLAKEKKLDPRVVATICAKAGKKDEAFAIFSDFIREAPEDRKKELAFQSVNLLSNVATNLGKEFFTHLMNNNVLSLSIGQADCAEVALLLREGKIVEAENKMNLLLDSSFAESDLIDTAILLVSRLNQDLRKLDSVRKLLEKLLKKFPDDLRVKLQWIDSLTVTEPKTALIELDNLKQNSLEFYTKHQQVIRLLRGKAFDKMGEIDRAKMEYQELMGQDGVGGIAKDKIEYYETLDRLEQELQEKIAKSNQSQHELLPNSHRRWGIIVAINVVFIALILYTIYRRKKQ